MDYNKLLSTPLPILVKMLENSDEESKELDLLIDKNEEELFELNKKIDLIKMNSMEDNND